jgi:hypothetical protein
MFDIFTLGIPRRIWGIILKRIFQNWNVLHGLFASGSGQGQVEGSCECSNKPPGFIKCGKFFDLLRNS